MKFIIEHLSKRFEQKEVLKDIDFTFEEGRIYGLLGRNGAGKTTLFNCLNRDIKADSGSFYIEENGVRREVAAEDIGYVLSTPTVPEFLTGREFLKFFVDINSDSIRDPKPLDEYFAEMSIAPEDRDKLLKDYSHGMKNKMQMLVNIIAQPNILLLDEPLTSLDVVVAGGSPFSPPTSWTWPWICATRSCCSATGSWRWWRSPTWTTTPSRRRSSRR